MTELIYGLLFGIVQGLTEFLPVSSSGHLEILDFLVGRKDEALPLLVPVVAHAGTLMSIFSAMRQEIVSILSDVIEKKNRETYEYIAGLIVSVIPAGLVYFVAGKHIEALFSGNMLVVGAGLMFTGLVILGVERFAGRVNKRLVHGWILAGFVMGIAQALALVPGISRSGIVISTGLMLGIDRREAVRFAFLMAVLPIAGGTVMELLKGWNHLGVVNAGMLVVVFSSAWLFGHIACRVMLRLVESGKWLIFGIYCLVVGILVMLYGL